MKQTSENFIVDTFAFVAFVFLTTTGVLMRYVLPPGSGHSTTIWGLDRHDWGGLHFWISITFFALLAIHLVSHWRWIASVVRGRPRQGSGLRLALGVVGLTALIALSVSPLVAPVVKNTPATAGGGLLSGHEYEDIQVRGSMTLLDVEKGSGVPAAYIINALGLPPTTPRDQRLGALKRAHGLELNDVREAIREYRERAGD